MQEEQSRNLDTHTAKKRARVANFGDENVLIIKQSVLLNNVLV